MPHIITDLFLTGFQYLYKLAAYFCTAVLREGCLIFPSAFRVASDKSHIPSSASGKTALTFIKRKSI